VKDLLNFGQMLSVHARLSPDRVGARDLERSMTFAQWNDRSCRLANALLGLGLGKGDRVAILAYNCVEWCEIFAATAKAGLVADQFSPDRQGSSVHPGERRSFCPDRAG
jgi:fatty-acyl-CoA synthase